MIAVTGAKGQLGSELCRQLAKKGTGSICAQHPQGRPGKLCLSPFSADVIPLDLPEFDITDRDAVRRLARAERPEAVINCAAYTAVDRAEAEAEACYRVNAEAVGHLAEACHEAGSTLVQISTAYVFDGNGARRMPFSENDPPSPQSVYAKSKLAGEEYAANCERHFVVRTCGLYSDSPAATNFVNTMLRLGREGERVAVVGDQRCSPSYVRHVALAIVFLLGTDRHGTYHVVNSGAATWHDLAAEIFRLANMHVELQAITTAQYAAPAPRPAYSVLDTTKYHQLGGPQMPSWQEAIAECFGRRIDAGDEIRDAG